MYLKNPTTLMPVVAILHTHSALVYSHVSISLGNSN